MLESQIISEVKKRLYDYLQSLILLKDSENLEKSPAKCQSSVLDVCDV